MAKSSAFDNSLLRLIFNGSGITGLADNTATSPNTSLYVSLHTADPGVGGSQTTSEVTYTGYARVAVVRTTSGWTVTGASVSPAAAISFPAGTGGSGTATNWAVGMGSTGSGTILYTGTISPTITCGAGITPSLTTATTVTES